MTYATLKSDVAVWARRSDLTSAIPSFVALAESEIYKTHAIPLRVREMEEEASLTVTGLTADLPADYLEARYIKLDDADKTTLLYMPPAQWNQYKEGFFTVVGTEVRLPNGVTSNLTLGYIAKPAALTNNTDTNAVLETYYGIYLSATMKYASVYVKDVASAQIYQTQLDTYMDGASKNNKPITAGQLVVRAA